MKIRLGTSFSSVVRGESDRLFLSRIGRQVIGVVFLSLTPIAVSREPALQAQDPSADASETAQPAQSQPSTPAPTPAPSPTSQAAPACSATEYRQFDFWLGEWDVRSANGNLARNSITRLHDDCGLLETYANGAFRGSSLNYYDQASGKWFQTWVDNGGGSLRLSGGLEGNSMVLSTAPGSNPFDRITWTPRPDGSVRQHWQRSTDGGQSWTDVFDGIYVKKSALTKNE